MPSVEKTLYLSPEYDPGSITDRYLYFDLRNNRVVVNETIKTQKTNYTYRSYVLPTEEYPKYSKAIAAAEEIKGCFPYEVRLVED